MKDLKEKLSFLASDAADDMEGNLITHSSSVLFFGNKYEVATHESECPVWQIAFNDLEGKCRIDTGRMAFLCHTETEAVAVLCSMHRPHLPNEDVQAFIDYVSE